MDLNDMLSHRRIIKIKQQTERNENNLWKKDEITRRAIKKSALQIYDCWLISARTARQE